MGEGRESSWLYLRSTVRRRQPVAVAGTSRVEALQCGGRGVSAFTFANLRTRRCIEGENRRRARPAKREPPRVA